MASSVTAFAAQPLALVPAQVQSTNKPGLDEIFHRKQEQVYVIKRPDFIRSFTVTDNKIYLLTHALPSNSWDHQNTNGKVVVLDFETRNLIEDFEVSIGRLPYHMAIFDRWVICAAQELGVLAFFDRVNKQMPPVQINLGSAFENRSGSVQGLAITKDAIYVAMWTHYNQTDRQGHILKVQRDHSQNQIFFPQKIEVLFTEKGNDIGNIKIVDDKLYFSDGQKVFCFDEASKRAKMIYDAECVVWSFDILPDGQAVVKNNDSHHSKDCIKACEGYLLYEAFSGVTIKRVGDKTQKVTKEHDEAYHLHMIEVYNGALLALHRNYQYKSSSLIIWSGV